MADTLMDKLAALSKRTANELLENCCWDLAEAIEAQTAAQCDESSDEKKEEPIDESDFEESESEENLLWEISDSGAKQSSDSPLAVDTCEDSDSSDNSKATEDTSEEAEFEESEESEYKERRQYLREESQYDDEVLDSLKGAAMDWAKFKQEKEYCEENHIPLRKLEDKMRDNGVDDFLIREFFGEEVFDSLKSVALVVSDTCSPPALASALLLKVGASAQLVACGSLDEDSAPQWTAVVVCESLAKKQLIEVRKAAIAKMAIFIMAVSRGTVAPVFVDASRTSLGAEPMFGTIPSDFSQQLFEASLDCHSEAELCEALGEETAVQKSAEIKNYWTVKHP